MGLTAYRQVLREERENISRDPHLNSMIKRVGQRIANVVDRSDYDWEFRVIDKPEANAFALPGGKVAVYTGILRYTQDDTGLATVLGHEIAHVLARHGGERVSQTLLAQIGLAALQAGMRNSDPTIMQGIGLAYGLGVQLPFGRSQESEADHIGLVLMAKAGYDPREAIDFWERMSRGKDGQGPPEFLSTHPSGETRREQIQEWLPEALHYYHGADERGRERNRERNREHERGRDRDYERPWERERRRSS
jgi:predicted Zn-dependent protease